MKHKVRIERHLVRDILASILGGSLVVAVAQNSWVATCLTLIVGLVLFLVECVDIEEEEQ